jgi:hypothetical protein
MPSGNEPVSAHSSIAVEFSFKLLPKWCSCPPFRMATIFNKINELLAIRRIRCSRLKVLIFYTRKWKSNPSWHHACYDFWKNTQTSWSIQCFGCRSAVLARVTSIQTIALPGPNHLIEGGSRNEGKLYSAGAPRAADSRTAAPGLRQRRDRAAAQNG